MWLYFTLCVENVEVVKFLKILLIFLFAIVITISCLWKKCDFVMGIGAPHVILKIYKVYPYIWLYFTSCVQYASRVDLV